MEPYPQAAAAAEAATEAGMSSSGELGAKVTELTAALAAAEAGKTSDLDMEAKVANLMAGVCNME